MSTGLLALLDDVAAIAKIAAASIDDVGVKAATVSGKAAGIVIDDTAVTPRYVVGFTADRELPIIWKIARGSLVNKLVFLLPGALGLSLVAPWLITPLLMVGGAYLCLEGWHKALDYLGRHHPEASGDSEAVDGVSDAVALENAKVAGAIRTDLILSAEIMAIALATVAAETFWLRAVLLAIVGLVMTAAVYGVVALIVKADDVGAALARRKSRLARVLGRGIVRGMPRVLAIVSFIGMAAMLWVGAGILIHGLHGLGWNAPEHALKALGSAVSGPLPFGGGAVAWLVEATVAGVLGLAVGALVDPAVRYALKPLAARVGRLMPRPRTVTAPRGNDGG